MVASRGCPSSSQRHRAGAAELSTHTRPARPTESESSGSARDETANALSAARSAAWLDFGPVVCERVSTRARRPCPGTPAARERSRHATAARRSSGGRHVQLNVRLLPGGAAHAQALLQPGRAVLLPRGTAVQRGHHPGCARLVAAGARGPMDRRHRAAARRGTALLPRHRLRGALPGQGGPTQARGGPGAHAELHLQLALQRHGARRVKGDSNCSGPS